MFSEFELDLVNAELAEIAAEKAEAAVDLQYEEMMDAWMAEMMMMEYAARSYDEDCIYLATVF